ncbi:hypothetical protein BpHYR1_043069 [Brachionus plicatilis]|uniref:Uncharacterized protein n=1 Tax=Brachionus plicatilis TaxID=10195 RepID=A0A3M7Q9I9_BRAPC|nr:hypothetical protein BpHYR1_043069 [Brachionus plicatilis]
MLIIYFCLIYSKRACGDGLLGSHLCPDLKKIKNLQLQSHDLNHCHPEDSACGIDTCFDYFHKTRIKN